MTTPSLPTAATGAAVQTPPDAHAPTARAASFHDLDALLLPDAGVAPTLALLVGGWHEAADADARARWIQPLLPALLHSDGGDASPAARRAVEARRAELAAAGAVPLVAAIRGAGAGTGGFLSGMRRHPGHGAPSVLARFDALTSTVTDLLVGPQLAARHARLARAAATVATRPTIALAHEQLALQARAFGEPIETRPAAPLSPDATAAWADAWHAEDPRAGAAYMAAGHAAQVVRRALTTPDVRADAVHGRVARTVLQMCGEGRTPEARQALAATLADGPLADLVGALGALDAPAAPVAVPVAPVPSAPAAPVPAPPVRTLGPTVTDVRFDAARGHVVLTLDSGTTVAIPATLVPALAGATADRRAAVQIAGDGSMLQWPELRVEVPVRGLLIDALELSA